MVTLQTPVEEIQVQIVCSENSNSGEIPFLCETFQFTLIAPNQATVEIFLCG